MTDYLSHKNDFNDPRLASVVDELSFWSSRFGHLLFDNIQIRKGLNILDVGCANGFPLFELAHVFGDSCRVTGIDIWQEALERARSKLAFYDLGNVRIIEADGAEQPFADAEFDLIVSNLGINNWTNPQAVLQECFRVAKPQATIVLTTNIEGHYQQFYDLFRETLREIKKEECLERLAAQEAHRGSVESWSSLLQKTGWSIERVIEDSFEMRFADGSALLNHSLTKIGFLDGWKSVVEPEDAREVFGMMETKLNEMARHGGELRMTVPMLYLEGMK